ncbi:MAG: choice-of-anchor V domain-containing protein [Bacteroidia bacterium]
MKNKLLLGLAAFAITLAAVSIGLSDSNGKLGHGGAPSENTCSESACHGAGQGGLADNMGPGNITISCSNMPGWVYTPGQIYHFTVTVTQAGCNLFGFSAVAVNNGNGNAGSMTVTDNTHTRTGSPYGSTRAYITHTGFSSPLPGTATTTNPAMFIYDWTAPASNVGPIRIYFDGLAANNDLLEDAADNVYSGTQTITPASSVSSPLVMTSLNPGASFPIYLRTTAGVPSVPQSFDVAGLALTANLNVSVPAPFELSLSSGGGFSSSPISIAPVAGSVAATKIYIRYNPALSGSATATITVMSTGATSAVGYANSAIATPVISAPSVASLPTFTTVVGTPSAIDSFTVTSSGLVDNLNITAPAQFQISMHRYTAYVSAESDPIFIPTWGYSGMKVYVRYNPSVAGTHSGNVVISSTGATSKTVAVNGVSSATSIADALLNDNFNLFPNPSSGGAKMQFNLLTDQQLQITLNNLEGKMIRKITEGSFAKGKNELNIDCSDLPKGLYFVHIRSNEKDTYEKLILQ